MENIKYSIIIPVWNGEAFIADALKAVYRHPGDEPLEVICVNNASEDNAATVIATEFPQVRLLNQPVNLGFAGGVNVGIRQASGDTIVLLNQDTIVQPGWLQALSAELADPTVGIVGCKIFYPDGRIQHAGGIIDARGAATHIGNGELDTGQYNQPCDVDFVTGAAMALTTKTLKIIGLLDEGFSPAYYEDTDWCFRAKKAGLRVRYTPDATVVHAESTSTENIPLAKKTMTHTGRLRFLLKHRSVDALQTEFLPAEQIWLSRLGHSLEMLAVREAYLAQMLSLAEMVVWRSKAGLIAPPHTEQTEWDNLLQLFTTLRQTCLQSEAQTIVGDNNPTTNFLTPTSNHHWQELQDFWQLQEHTFRSSIPGLAFLRTIWYNIAARWADVWLMNQQTKVNWAVKNLMSTLAQAVGPTTDQTLREINLLAQRVVELEQQVAVLQKKLQKKQSE